MSSILGMGHMVTATIREGHPLYKASVKRVKSDPTFRRLVEEILDQEDHILIMPPETPKEGDFYLGDGNDWTPVTEYTYAEKPYGVTHFIVKRPSEHLRMYRFFFRKKT